jgi:hypothetical protein
MNAVRANMKENTNTKMISRTATIAIRIRNHMKTQTKQSTSPAPTFSIDVMIPAEREGELSRIVKAGTTDHPWPTIADVPEHLRQYIGIPRTMPPPDTPNQHWTSPQILEMERDAIERLNSYEGLNPTVAAELDARNAEYLKISKSRNETETELEEENRRKLGGKL